MRRPIRIREGGMDMECCFPLASRTYLKVRTPMCSRPSTPTRRSEANTTPKSQTEITGL